MATKLWDSGCHSKLVSAVAAVPNSKLVRGSHIFQSLVLALQSGDVDWLGIDTAHAAGEPSAPTYLDPTSAAVSGQAAAKALCTDQFAHNYSAMSSLFTIDCFCCGSAPVPM